MTTMNPGLPVDAAAPVKGPGRVPYVISLVVGLPTTAMMIYFAYDRLFPALTLVLAVLSALGCILAVVGIRSRPRRFRTASLLLTLIPGLVTIAGFAILVAVLVAFVTAAGTS